MSRTEHFWDIVCCAIDKMSVGKTAAIGGTGSFLSAASASVPDFTAMNEWALAITRAGGAVGVILSIGLMLFKGWLMWKHRDRPPA